MQGAGPLNAARNPEIRGNLTAVPILECRDVAARRPQRDGPPREVLAGVTFSVDAGDLVVVMGRSGSGKSSLLRLLNRFDDAAGGEIRFDGEPIERPDPLRLRRRVALVLQTPVVFEGSVRDNLKMASDDVTDASLSATLDAVDLDASEFLDRDARELSIGEKQRVAMARALLGKPDVLLLDEPTSSLDPRTTVHVADLLRKLNETGLTIIVVTHQPELVRRLGGRRFLIGDGTLGVDATDADVERFLGGD